MISPNATEGAPLQKVLTALRASGREPKQHGSGYTCVCPGHEDSKPSLSVSSGTDGRALLHCFAGCAPEAICGAIGLKLADLMPPRPNGNGHRAPKIVAEYDYHDETGALLFQVVRFNPKDFRQRQPDGSGGWTWSTKGARRVIYRLPTILAASETSFIFVVEGEKDVATLTARGLIATTTAGGAGKSHMTDLTPLHSRHVVVIPDSDAPGRNHAAQLAAALHGKAASLRIVELPGREKDVSDWLGAGGDAADLVALAEAAPPWTPGAEPAATPAKTLAVETNAGHREPSPVISSLIARCAADVVQRDVDWLWRPMLVAGAINMFIGMPDAGKGVATMDIAARVSRGAPWPALRSGEAEQPNPAGTVAIMGMEDSPETTTAPRLEVAGADMRKVQIVEGVLHSDGNGAKLRDSFDIARDADRLEELRRAHRDLRLVVIDPLDSYINGRVDTNIGNKVRAALWPLKDWCEASGVTVLIVHHFNKTATTNALDKVSGARSFGALPRSVWALGRDEADERTIIAPIKMNLVRREEKKAIAFEIRSAAHRDLPVVHWVAGEIATTAANLLGERGSKARDSAADCLRDLLADGPMDAREVWELVGQAGHSERTVKRAKEELGIVAEQNRSGDGRKVSGWTWRLPK